MWRNTRNMLRGRSLRSDRADALAHLILEVAQFTTRYNLRMWRNTRNKLRGRSLRSARADAPARILFFDIAQLTA